MDEMNPARRDELSVASPGEFFAPNLESKGFILTKEYIEANKPKDDFLNVWVEGVPMVSIPIKSETQRTIYNKVDQGKRDGGIFIAKMSESIEIPKG